MLLSHQSVKIFFLLFSVLAIKTLFLQTCTVYLYFYPCPAAINDAISVDKLMRSQTSLQPIQKRALKPRAA